MEDEEAVRHCQAGDRDAFRHLVDRYGGVLFGTAYLMTRDRSLAEELVQEALLGAWRGIGGFRAGEPVKPWLVRITVNRVLGHRRRRSLPVAPMPDGPEPGAPEPGLANADDRDAVGRALATLDEGQRQTVLLRYYAELTVSETAAVLGLPEGTVKSRLSRALARLREALEA